MARDAVFRDGICIDRLSTSLISIASHGHATTQWLAWQAVLLPISLAWAAKARWPASAPASGPHLPHACPFPARLTPILPCPLGECRLDCCLPPAGLGPFGGARCPAVPTSCSSLQAAGPWRQHGAAAAAGDCPTCRMLLLRTGLASLHFGERSHTLCKANYC